MAEFVPAAGRAWLTPAYDRTVALTMREGTFRGRLVTQVARPAPGLVVEVGCGTGALTLRLAEALPGARLVGIDPDAGVLARARGKDSAGRVDWREGMAQDLPLADGEADAIILSLVLHHLRDDAKRAALAEAARVLRPGGRVHVADWGRPGDPVMWATFTALRLLDGFAPTAAHARGQLGALLGGAGFGDLERHDRLRTGWGVLELWSGRAR